jgi:hypothetical protein
MRIRADQDPQHYIKHRQKLKVFSFCVKKYKLKTNLRSYNSNPMRFERPEHLLVVTSKKVMAFFFVSFTWGVLSHPSLQWTITGRPSV